MGWYTPYHKASADYAKELCKNATTQIDKYKLITSYLSRTVMYDYVRAIQIAKLKGQAPDIEGCWTKHMGICMDISALAFNMLKAVGIRCWVCIGYADRQYHAWVEAKINGKQYRYDHDGKAKKYITKIKCT